jgi:hypothetical protein
MYQGINNSHAAYQQLMGLSQEQILAWEREQQELSARLNRVWVFTYDTLFEERVT